MRRGVVYVNFAARSPRAQVIYKIFTPIFDVEIKTIEAALNDLTAAECDCNVENLKSAARRCKENSELHQLVQNLKESVRYYDTEDETIEKRIAQKSLSGHVLFIDEALVGASEHDLKRLRFLRDLGRALNMRVILAGTSVTAVHFMDLPQESGRAGSRQETNSEAWAVVIFLCRKHDDFVYGRHHASLAPSLSQGRPWIVNLSIDRNHYDMSARDIILNIADDIDKAKKLKWEYLSVELSGTWLRGNFVAPIPFQFRSEDLIKNSLFEPSIRIVADSKTISVPYLGLGMAQVKQQCGPLGVVVQNMDVGEFGVQWVVGHREEDFKDSHVFANEVSQLKNSDVGVGKNFGDVQDMFRGCVQQCLAREPILALAMTIVAQRKFVVDRELPLSPLSFRPSQTGWTKGEVDGEWFEYIARIAVQMASWNGFKKSEEGDESMRGAPLMSSSFLHEMHNILSRPIDLTHTEAAARGDALKRLGIQCGVVQDHATNWDNMIEPFLSDDASPINKYWESFEVPWLALACDAKSFEDSVTQNPHLGSLNIAGLIPHAISCASLDTTVVQWKVKTEAKREEVMLLEFKARRDMYSANEGLEDLRKKVDSHFEGYPSKRLWTILHLVEEEEVAKKKVASATTEATRSAESKELNNMKELLAQKRKVASDS